MKMTAYTVRRIKDKTVWYLHDFETTTNRAYWTKNFAQAHKFNRETDAKTFIETELEHCMKECDVFHQDTAWMI